MAVLFAPVAAAEPRQVEHPADALARRAWTITEVILEKHVDPPARQQLFLGAVQALLRETGTAVPADLSRRISALATREQFGAFIEEFWPKAGPTANLEAVVFQGLFARLPGGGAVLPPESLKITDQIAFNRYVGLGIQIAVNQAEHLPEIRTPIRGGPAHQGGIKPGDLIAEVDGKTTRGLPLRKVVDLLRGEEGSKVMLTLRRPGVKESHTLTMTRSVVPFENVLGYRRGTEKTWEYTVDPSARIAYAAVSSLTSSTLHELRRLERRLHAEGIRALVLDLRFNAGGLLQHSTLVADGLLDGGVLWRVRDGSGRVQEIRADRDCLFRDCSLVVLVGPHSGPGAAWVAAALQDNRRAVVVGAAAPLIPYVRSSVTLPEGQGVIRLATGLLERGRRPARVAPFAEGEEPAGQTLQPDRVVALTRKQQEKLNEWMNYKGFTELPVGVSDTPPEDPALAKAVELLRASLKGTPAARAR